MVDTASTEIIDSYVRSHNAGVASGDFSAMLDLFADDAELVFASIQFGPFNGRESIRAAFAAHPPDDDLVIIAAKTTQDGVLAAYSWSTRPGRVAGSLEVTVRDGRIARMVIVFDG